MSYPWAADNTGHSFQIFMNTYVDVDPSINQKTTML